MDLQGIGDTSYTFSPADFLDAEEFRPTGAAFDIIGNGSTTPYTDGVSGLIQTHIGEIKTKAPTSLPGGWKKRLRNFISQKNSELLKFLDLPVSTHPTLSKGDHLLRKFGTIKYQTDNSLKNIILDASGLDVLEKINVELLALRKDSPIEDYNSAVKFMFDEYKKAGEEAFRYDMQLKEKLDCLDKIQDKLSGVIDLEPIEPYNPLMEATEVYIKGLYDKYTIEEDYKGFIQSYKRFLLLRDTVLMTKTIDTAEQEPMCIICLSEPVSYVLTPCGHTYCSGCIKKQHSACFICRGTIRDRVKIFFA